jgi:hypothetical protein
VESTLTAEATPFAASVLDPVDPVPAKISVSDVMAIVTVLTRFIKSTTVPIGYETLEFAGMVNVRALLSEAG